MLIWINNPICDSYAIKMKISELVETFHTETTESTCQKICMVIISTPRMVMG